MSPRAAVRTLTTLAALLAVLVLGGCSSEFGGPANQSGAEATGSGPARSKLLLQIQDPCYSGDARAESAKRVASAVGEGAMAVMLVHRYLERL